MCFNIKTKQKQPLVLCSRCKRPLVSAESRRNGIGKGCARKLAAAAKDKDKEDTS